jgi:hypothetical protein
MLALEKKSAVASRAKDRSPGKLKFSTTGKTAGLVSAAGRKCGDCEGWAFWLEQMSEVRES